LVIALAFGAAGYRFVEGAVIEALGLLGLGAGLLCLRLASRWPALGRASLLGFALTVVAISIALYRLWLLRSPG
jgi:hypothetical protein